MSRFAGTAILLAVLLAGCSKTQSISPEELKSDATELASIAAESELFATFVAHGQATDAYTQGHSESLREQSKDFRKELEKKYADPSRHRALVELQELSLQLNESLNALPASSGDARWPELASSFGRLASAARSVRRAP